MKTLLTISAIALLFTACTQPDETAKSEHDHDVKELMALNVAYKDKKIDAMTYLKKSRVLNKKIDEEEDLLGINAHNHTH